MKVKGFAILISVLFLLTCIPHNVSSANLSTLELKIVGEASNPNNNRLISGVVHNLTLDLTTPSTDIDILFYQNASLFGVNTSTLNTYSWFIL